MKSMHFGLIAACAMSFVTGVGPARAQDAPNTSFTARIVAGTCNDPGQDMVVQLADLTYGSGEEVGTDTAGAAQIITGSPETALVATGVTQLEMTAQELTDEPHAVAVFASTAGSDGDPIACGVIGGVAPDQNLFFGLLEREDSGYAGIGWLNTTADRVLLTLMLTSLTPMTPIAALSLATPNIAASAATETVPEADARSPVVGVGSEQNESTVVAATPTRTVTPAAASDAAAATSAATHDATAETATIESVDIGFIPDEVTISANTDAIIVLPNNGTIRHTFVINDKNNPDASNLDIHVEMAPGSNEQVTVNAPAGDYHYWCDIPGHEVAGMFGTLHVTQG